LRTGLSIDSSNRGGHHASTSWGQLGQDLYIRDRVDELLKLPVPPAPFQFTSNTLPSSPTTSSSTLALEAPPPRADETVPLIQGFQATIPTSNQARFERRKRRAIESEQRLGLKNGTKLGLKERGERARGLLGNVREEQGIEGEGDLRIGRRTLSDGKEKTTTTTTTSSRNDLEGDLKAVGKDMNNVKVRRALLNGQIRDVETKIKELEIIRDGFRKGLLGLREEELELEDESKPFFPLHFPDNRYFNQIN
jgi:division protein 1